MNKYSVCILDESIPAIKFLESMDNTKLLNRGNIGQLLSDERLWDEPPLYKLAHDLYSQEDEYEVNGFTHHSFFFNHIEENIFSPDIIIFDWDIGKSAGGEEADPRGSLLKLLKLKYCLVAIFTGADNEDRVSNVIAEDDFKDFIGNRLFLIKKDGEDSVSELQAKIKQFKSENFSFGLGRDLKKTALQSVENILINIGKLSFDQFVTAFGHLDKSINKVTLSKIDFTDLFVEKLQTELLNSNFGKFPIEANNKKVDDDLLLKKIWHFRLYHFPKDEIIRKGDILKKEGDDRLFLVLTSDCHLTGFWKKNYGHLILVPLFRIDNPTIRNKIRINNNSKSITSFSITSIVNPRSIENITIFPALHELKLEFKDEETGKISIKVDYVDYILSPKETFSIDIQRPEGVELWMPLKTSHLNGYGGNERIRITEPFLSPLTQYIISQVAGYGTPDYSKQLEEILIKNIQSIRDDKI